MRRILSLTRVNLADQNTTDLSIDPTASTATSAGSSLCRQLSDAIYLAVRSIGPSNTF